MRQIFDINARFENVGDYAWLDITDEDYEIHRVLAFRFSDYRWAFYCKRRLFSGSSGPRAESVISRYPFLSEYEYSWIVSVEHSIMWGIRDLEDRLQLGENEYKIVTTPIPLAGEIDMHVDSDSSSSEYDVRDFININYTSEQMYCGQYGYHHHRSVPHNCYAKPYRGHRIGIELEVEFNTEDEHDVFKECRSNWFYLERDGSLDENGCEIITIPLHPSDAKDCEFWKTLTDFISGHASSWNTGRCGLHVHMGREILGKTSEQQSETIGRLLYLYHHYVKDTRMNIKIYGRECGYHDQDGKTTVGEAAKIFGAEIFKTKSVAQKVKDEMISKSRRDRYFDINLMNEHTIEFRKGKGSINPNRIAMVVDYCERMCIYAKNTPWQQISYEDFVNFLKATVTNVDLKKQIEQWS